MNILMMTNTYLPHVGGVARSVDSFATAFRKLEHRVLVVAPEFEGQAETESHVVRLPAIQRFNGSDFSLRLPVPGLLSKAVQAFEPHVVHSHHPFLIGDTALRVAAKSNLPLVFTHHTLYERYTHYVPADSVALKTFAASLATEYANLCQHVIAPSQSIADLLRQRGVAVPVSVIPTGIDCRRFRRGHRAACRRRLGIGPRAFVVGHVGRLAPEKNLPYLAQAVAQFLRRRTDAFFLVVGNGPSAQDLRLLLPEDRLRTPGTLQGQDLVDAYHAMDVFAFASTSETQGLVVAEAMAAGLPVVALDAPGVREVVRHAANGWLLADDAPPHTFAEALLEAAALPRARRRQMAKTATDTAADFDIAPCARQTLQLYKRVRRSWTAAPRPEENAWTQLLRRLELEWNLISARTEAAVQAIKTAVRPPSISSPDSPNFRDTPSPKSPR